LGALHPLHRALHCDPEVAIDHRHCGFGSAATFARDLLLLEGALQRGDHVAARTSAIDRIKRHGPPMHMMPRGRTSYRNSSSLTSFLTLIGARLSNEHSRVTVRSWCCIAKNADPILLGDCKYATDGLCGV